MKKKIIVSLCIVFTAVFSLFSISVAANDFLIYGCVSYYEFEDAFVNRKSTVYNEIINDDNAGKFDYNDRLFMSWFLGIADGLKKLPIPLYKGEEAELHDDDGKQIAIFSSREFDLPWVWYYCDFEDFKTIVKVGFPEVLDSSKTAGLTTYRDYCKKLASDLPTVDTPKEEYKEKYSSVTEETLTLADGIKVEATVYHDNYEKTKFKRNTYNFVYDGRIYSVMNFYSDEVEKFTADFWKSFSVKNVIASEAAAKSAKEQGTTSDTESTVESSSSQTASQSEPLFDTPAKKAIVFILIGVAVLLMAGGIFVAVQNRKNKNSGE